MKLVDSPILMAFLATLFTWGMTAAGAALVFFFKTIKKSVLNTMLGFASGVMIAASYGVKGKTGGKVRLVRKGTSRIRQD